MRVVQLRKPVCHTLFAVIVCLLLTSLAFPATLTPPDSELSPCWREKDGSTLFCFEEDRILLSSAGRLQVASIMERKPNLLVVRRNGLTEIWKLSVSPDILRIETSGQSRTFERLAVTPPELTLEPFRLGEMRSLSPERIQEITSEIKRRYALDQEPRQVLMKNAQDEKALARLQEVDADNRRYLRGLLADIGWLDFERFGKGTVSAVTIMIKHQNDLAVQMAVLPLVERDLSRAGSAVEPYVVLFDGLRVNLGQPQRFGSQIGEDASGKPCVLELEDLAKVDDFREEAGLVPLAEYLAQASQFIFGGQPVQLHCGQPSSL